MSKKNNLKLLKKSDKKQRYKAYKANKSWAYATITSVAGILSGGAALPLAVHAQTNEGKTTEASSSSTSKLLANQKSTTIPASDDIKSDSKNNKVVTSDKDYTIIHSSNRDERTAYYLNHGYRDMMNVAPGPYTAGWSSHTGSLDGKVLVNNLNENRYTSSSTVVVIASKIGDRTDGWIQPHIGSEDTSAVSGYYAGQKMDLSALNKGDVAEWKLNANLLVGSNVFGSHAMMQINTNYGAKTDINLWTPLSSDSESGSNSNSLSDSTSDSNSENPGTDSESTSGSESDSLSDNGSESDSTSDSLSDNGSESNSTSDSLSDNSSESNSTSDSLSDNGSESDSTSDSLSDSNSLSDSDNISESNSHSNSQSDSTSDSLSDSNSLSDSDNISDSEST
ncbi:KxYKxGKxW signal peptide domain-containing protein, partial [Weissella koreensis]